MKFDNSFLLSIIWTPYKSICQVSYNEFMDEGKGQFGCLAKLNTGPQVISKDKDKDKGKDKLAASPN